MAMFVDEEEAWKCQKHPSRRRRSGICPKCLRERLDGLCPDCAGLRPCSCCAASVGSSSSSSSSSFSRFFAGETSSAGSLGRVSNLIDSEPSFRRSRSVAVPFLRSRSKVVRELEPDRSGSPHRTSSSSSSSFWGLFRRDKSKRSEATAVVAAYGDDVAEAERRRMMTKSRSVVVSSNPLRFDVSSGRPSSASSTKGRSWHFPSPMKAFRHSKTPKVVLGHERSPLYRG